MGELAVSIPRNLSEFLHACGFEIRNDPCSNFLMVTSTDRDVTKKEAARFDELTAEAQEIILATNMRLETRVKSLAKAQHDYFKSEQEFLGSILDYAEDDNDDFETGYLKKCRSGEIEEKYAGDSIRYNWELRDAAKCSIYK